MAVDARPGAHGGVAVADGVGVARPVVQWRVGEQERLVGRFRVELLPCVLVLGVLR